MISYQSEKWREVVNELKPLFQKHYEEVGNKDLPMNMAYKKYQAMEDMGMLHVVSVRDSERLVGYNITIVTGGLHYQSSALAFTDLYYLEPEYRKGFTWSRLLKFVEEEMKNMGIKYLWTGIKLTTGYWSKVKILKRRGYKPDELLFKKMIGE